MRLLTTLIWTTESINQSFINRNLFPLTKFPFFPSLLAGLPSPLPGHQVCELSTACCLDSRAFPQRRLLRSVAVLRDLLAGLSGSVRTPRAAATEQQQQQKRQTFPGERLWGDLLDQVRKGVAPGERRDAHFPYQRPARREFIFPRTARVHHGPLRSAAIHRHALVDLVVR